MRSDYVKFSDRRKPASRQKRHQKSERQSLHDERNVGNYLIDPPLWLVAATTWSSPVRGIRRISRLLAPKNWATLPNWYGPCFWSFCRTLRRTRRHYPNMTMPPTELTVASLLERVAKLEEAIAPFARVAGWFDHQRPMHSIIRTGNGDVTVDDLLAARAVLAAAIVQPLSVKWSHELPLYLRPINLIEQYPRIVNFIALKWNNPTAVCKYLDDLLIDHHGSRNGFPDEVCHELRSLGDYCRQRLSPQSDRHAQNSAP